MITKLLSTTRKLPVLVIGLCFVAFFGVGCSLDSTGVGPTNESQIEETTSFNEVLPGIVLPEGLELVSMNEIPLSDNNGALDDGTTGNRPNLCGSGWVTVAEGGVVEYDGYAGAAFDAGEMPYDAEVTVCMPHPGWAIAEYGPHPLAFNGTVDIWFALYRTNLPDQAYERLQLWYVADNGDLEAIPLTIDRENGRAVGHTTHFSRYILTVSTLYLK